jgi:DNA-binding response OmpR family regulator|nr:response regulator transcription factor [uncultured Psychroserpens sp.]
MKTKLLLVEDEKTLSELLTEFLETEGYSVHCAYDGEEGFKLFNSIKPDICIFDIMMPILSGFSLLEKVRSVNSEIPVLLLTARGLKADIINGLKLGADDYVTKPFNFQELNLRLKNILKRGNTLGDKSTYKIGKYNFNHNTQLLEFESSKQILTTMEANMLNLFFLNKNKTLERKEILQAIWNSDDFFNHRSTDVFVSKLRKYLSKDPSIKILSIRGKGYKLII